MSTEAALLRAIRDMPDEDTPRLMYADYLDEDGYSARAEFIRVQVERSQLPERDPRRVPLEDRAHDLLAEHERAWLGVAPDDVDGLTEWEFDRGFVHEVAASPVFMRTAGTVHIALSRSISDHCAKRSSPGRNSSIGASFSAARTTGVAA